MKQETIKQIILTAERGMYLTNGETYGKTIILPEGANIEAWHEITDAEYEQKQKEIAESDLPEGAYINGNTNDEYEVK